MTAPTKRGVTEPKGDRMSRTDKTRPMWVQVADTRLVTCVPHHDHRYGPCKLPDEITAVTVVMSEPRNGCSWSPNGSTMYNLSNGCRSCTGYYFRREERRRDRQKTRRELRRYRSED